MNRWKSLPIFLAAAAILGSDVHAQEPPPSKLPPLPADTDPSAPAAAEQKAPPAAVASAVEAVRALGEQVVRGNFRVAVDRMYPKWKELVAVRAGGMEKLQEQLDSVPKLMTQNGVSMISFKPAGPPRSFEVGNGKKVDPNTGREVFDYQQWLVLVPTVNQVRMFIDGEKRPRVIESTGFQVAIADKNQLEWTFIDGAGLDLNDLRTLFINLPADLELPPMGRREIQE